MSRIPTYDPTVNFEITPQADVSGPIDSMINDFKQFGADVSAIGTAEINKQNTQDRLALKYNISRAYTNFANQALVNPDKNSALQIYQQQSKQYADSISKAAGEDGKGFVSSLANYYSQAHYQPLLKNALAQNKSMATSSAIDKLNEFTNNMNLASVNPNPAAGNVDLLPKYDAKLKSLKADLVAGNISQQEFSTQQNTLIDNYNQEKSQVQALPIKDAFNSISQTINGMAVQGLIKPAEQARMIQSYKEKYLENYIDLEYSKAVKTGTSHQFASQFLSQLPANVNRLDAERAVAKIISLHTRLAQDTGLSKVSVASALNQAVKNTADNGAMPDAKAAQDYIDMNPGSEKIVNQKFKVAQSQNQIQTMVMGGQFEQAQKLLEMSKPKDANAPGAAVQNEIHQAQVQALHAAHAKFNSDPMDGINKSPIGQNLLNKDALELAVSDKQADPNSPLSKIKNYNWDKVRNLQILSHINKPRFMTNDIANESIAYLSTASTANQVRFFDQMHTHYQKQADFETALGQLADKGLSRSLQYLAMFSPDTDNINDVRQGLSVPTPQMVSAVNGAAGDPKNWEDSMQTANQAIYGTKATGSFANYLSTIKGNPAGRDPQFLNDLRNAVMKVAGQLYLNGKAGSLSDGIKQAQNLFGNNYQYTNFLNQTIALPKNVNKNNVVANLLKHTGDLVKNYPFVTPPPRNEQNPALFSKEFRQHEILSGHWANASDSQHLVWVNRSGVAPVSKDGHELKISIEDLDNGDLPQTTQSKIDQNRKIVGKSFSDIVKTVGSAIVKSPFNFPLSQAVQTATSLVPGSVRRGFEAEQQREQTGLE